MYRAGGCTIRIGRRPADRLFAPGGAAEAGVALAGVAQATLVTAWNPRSRRMPEGWNRRMQQRLRERLRRRVVREADGALGGWREAMLLVGGPPAPVIRLARRFRQHAVVALHRGRPRPADPAATLTVAGVPGSAGAVTPPYAARATMNRRWNGSSVVPSALRG
ncbi:MAG: DUF3293 domain-containing protein [Acetobacteraceae bacterium]